MPGTLTGLLLFAVFALPGYLWVRAGEVYAPRADRSGLTEAAELVLVGLVTTTIAATIILLAVSDLSLELIFRESPGYLLDRLSVALLSLAATLGLSMAIAWVAARIWFSRRVLAARLGLTKAIAWVAARLPFSRGARQGKLQPGSTPWFEALVVGSDRQDVTVQIATGDGRCYWGSVVSFTVDPDSTVPDIALGPKIYTSEPNGGARVCTADRLIVPGSEIREVQVRYVT